MKILFLLPLIVFSGGHKSTINFFTAIHEDTTAIIHKLDGDMAEWPKEKFKTDNETKITYAVDNDKQTLFLAVNIPDKTIQKNVVQEGMNLYIDIKGKKKENRGIEFPIKIEGVSTAEKMKLFGFGDGESHIQSLKTEGSANIAIAWDSAFVIHIEYNIPLTMLEKTLGELNNKKISIGWRLKESEVPLIASQTSQPVTTTTRLVAVPSGSQPPVIRNPPNLNNNVRNVNNNSAPQSDSNKGQTFWTTYTIIL